MAGATTNAGAGMLSAPVRVEPVRAADGSGDTGLRRPMLRITTCGSVDDGKSTLIGRLLYDCAAVPLDQMAAVVETSRRKGHEQVDLALLTDGLRAEREQGITIDVAYRYFDSPSRRIIIADAPGHEQYTRNMATAASVADLAIVLIDARLGVSVQTRRHTLIAAMLRVPIVVFAINKCDLVGYDRALIEKIEREALAMARDLETWDVDRCVHTVPIAALHGENVARKSEHTPWYAGPTLLDVLDHAEPERAESGDLRFPVQYVVRPRSDTLHDYRGYTGTVLSGAIKPGDQIVALPSGHAATVREVHLGETNLDEGRTGQAVAVTLDHDIDAPRGEVFVHSGRGARPTVATEIEADIVWMDARKLTAGTKLLLKHAATLVKAIVGDIVHKVDLGTWQKTPGETLSPCELALNDVGRVTLRLSGPIVCDPYEKDRHTGSFVLVSDQTGNTIAGGMILRAIDPDAE